MLDIYEDLKEGHFYLLKVPVLQELDWKTRAVGKFRAFHTNQVWDARNQAQFEILAYTALENKPHLPPSLEIDVELEFLWKFQEIPIEDLPLYISDPWITYPAMERICGEN